MKNTVSLFCFSLISSLSFGQDTLKVMSWNLLNYNTTTAQSRNQYYRTVLRHSRPDVLVVQEINQSSGSTQQASVDSFYNRVVNVVFPGQFSKGTFIPDPNDTGNEIFYRTTKFTFVANTPIHTVLRDISEFKLYNATAADTLRIYSVHLKASTGFEADRAAEVDSLRRVTNAFPPGKSFLVVGDFNIYTSTEPAYTRLRQDNPTDDGHFIDVLTMTGTWNNGTYAPYHTQSTRTRQLPDAGSTGGLDDRFDMILFSRAISQPGRIQYLSGSLTAIGNDGNHYNDSINQMPNTSVPDSVANGLYYASDHLPLSARFVFNQGAGTNFTITATAGPNGGINPNGPVTVPSGGTQSFAIQPNIGYHVDSVIVDGLMMGAPASYVFDNVQSNHIIRAVFAINRYTITSSAGSHGFISPSGTIIVDYGTSQRYSISSAAGYHVDSVVVDGARVDSVTGYTFANVTSNHFIQAYFGLNQYIISASAGLHGSILPSGAVSAAYGSSILFSMTADSGYELDSLVVDGAAVAPATSYQFVNITSDHSIRAVFGSATLLVRQYPVSAGWNLVSLPMTVSDPRRQSVFPTATSGSFFFDPELGYVASDTLQNGKGYWLQFSNQQNVSISGVARSADTLQVAAGWNLIGSITDPRPVSLIQQLPPAIVVSPFFGYAGSYAASDTIRPAAAYWVKVSQSGRLILR